jgi:hypothetical protein
MDAGDLSLPQTSPVCRDGPRTRLSFHPRVIVRLRGALVRELVRLARFLQVSRLLSTGRSLRSTCIFWRGSPGAACLPACLFHQPITSTSHYKQQLHLLPFARSKSAATPRFALLSPALEWPASRCFHLFPVPGKDGIRKILFFQVFVLYLPESTNFWDILQGVLIL